MLTKAIEPVLASLRLPAYHRHPEFHASIAWALGEPLPLTVLQRVNERYEKQVLEAQPAGWEVEQIRIKVGNRVHAVGLGGGGLSSVDV